MKKALIGAAIVLAVGGYFWWSTRATTTVPGSSLGTTATPESAGTPANKYKDGTYTGSVVDSIYGPVQVAVTISGGKITQVDVPVYPDDGGNNTEVSNFSLPVLKQETIAAQSAEVDIVSGATQTSEAFQESLASALAHAA